MYSCIYYLINVQNQINFDINTLINKDEFKTIAHRSVLIKGFYLFLYEFIKAVYDDLQSDPVSRLVML